MDSSSSEAGNSVVSRGDMEGLLAAVSRRTTDAREGIFGPDSASWKVNREAALFLGAGRAALLQLAHPWVATSLVEHSNVMSKPIARFHNTFRIVFAMIFGSLDQALAASRHLHTVHTQIRGQMTEDVAAYRRGSMYHANEVGALRWVFATLVETAVLAYECVMPPLTAAELADYYADSKMLAALWGLSPSALPDDWTAFLSYCRETEQSDVLGVTEMSRSMAQGILSGAGSWIHPPHWYRALTADWMPERLRGEFGLDFGAAEQRATERVKKLLPRIYGALPFSIRYVGPWHEARARLDHRGAGMLAHGSNRFWIGLPELPFGEGL